MRYLFLRLMVALVTAGIGIGSSSFHPARCHRGMPFAKSRSLPLYKERDVFATETFDPDCPPAFKRRYFNYDYAYSVVIPGGMIGYGSCYTNHGFGIDLTDPTSNKWMKEKGNPKAFLGVDAYYNAGDLKSFAEAIKQNMQFPNKERVTDIALVSVKRTHLARLPAVHFVIHYNQAGEAMIEDHVIAFRKEPGNEIDILYSIELKTPQSRYVRDKEVASQIQNSWRSHRLP
jgi:hypothetical protein